ncbi:unnamed protein product [Didymodactylos carnosus]|uniref:Uncharacterized protein n=1 Tax=Didymodactylos carnosus TaxID=1234261 RepID=A0A814UTX7_9BILA|nr:unnamed protein product [Didymodactylos carnosus]CAF3946299.1 unnamed protein product [Didymodactylos carnosus]
MVRLGLGCRIHRSYQQFEFFSMKKWFWEARKKIPLAPEALRSCLKQTPTFTAHEIAKCLFPDQEKLTTLKASDLNHELFEYLKDRFPPPVVVDPCKIKEVITNTDAKARQSLGFLGSKVPERSNSVIEMVTIPIKHPYYPHTNHPHRSLLSQPMIRMLP